MGIRNGDDLFGYSAGVYSSTQNGTQNSNAHSWETTENDNNKNKEL